MILLFLGVLLWALLHLFVSLRVPLRARIIETLGQKKYQAGFALSIVISLVLIVVGWRASGFVEVYTPPALGTPLPMLLMLVVVYLFIFAKRNTRIKQYVRHPQLLAVALWGATHLLANGDGRSLVLFGGLGLWALVSIPIINRRDGAWVKPTPPTAKQDAIGVAIAVVAYAVLTLLHPYFAGVPVH